MDARAASAASSTHTSPFSVLPAASFGMSTITQIGFTPFAATAHVSGVMRLTMRSVFAFQRSVRAFSDATHTWNG